MVTVLGFSVSIAIFTSTIVGCLANGAMDTVSGPLPLEITANTARFRHGMETAMTIPETDIQDWWNKLVEYGVVPPETRRVIIDIDSEDVVKVYYSCYADAKMFTPELAVMLKGAKAVGVDECEAAQAN
jgi:hypothetical protein